MDFFSALIFHIQEKILDRLLLCLAEASAMDKKGSYGNYT